MKHLNTIISTVLMTATLCLPSQVKAQSPEKMSYQAVVRDASDKLVTNQVVGMQISILQGSPDGTAVYTETHTATSNANGLVSIEIGNGTVVSGNFSTINWANGSYFIKTETDPTGGTHFTIAGTSQLLSVPYALHAKTAESISYNDPEYNTDSELSSSNLKKAKKPDQKPKPKHFVNGGEIAGVDRTLGNTDNFALGFLTHDITRLHITNDGYVGIGNVTPFTKLDVSGVITAIGGTSTNWNTAYSWGDHAIQGYLTSFTETDPLFTVWDKDYADLTGTPTLSIANWNTAYSWGDHTGLYRSALWVPAWTDIIGKPTFATVATSGSYIDLANKPPNATTTADGFISSTDKTKLDAITGTNTGDQTLAGILTSNTDAGSKTISNLADPANAQDAATKAYVDALMVQIEVLKAQIEPLLIANGITDSRDGNHYDAVKIGDQVWMAENLKYLPEVHSNAGFITQGSGGLAGYGVYGYDGSDVATAKAQANYATHGVLYNWYVVNTTNVCPVGWHVPTDAEWKELEKALGMSQADADIYGWRGINEGSKMAGNASLWADGALDSDPEFGSSGFSALPLGYRFYRDGSFQAVGSDGYWWSSTVVGIGTYVYGRNLSYYFAAVLRGNFEKSHGFSVRCVKD